MGQLRLWAGLLSWLTATVVLFLCNHDAYHFPWLINPAYPVTIIAIVMVSISLAPPGLAAVLSAHRREMGALPLKALLLAIIWVILFMALGVVWIFGLEHFRKVDWGGCRNHASGKVVALGKTSSRGGAVEWAVYEFTTDGALVTSAVKNACLRLKPGQAIDVAYTGFWPRHSHPRSAP